MNRISGPILFSKPIRSLVMPGIKELLTGNFHLWETRELYLKKFHLMEIKLSFEIHE
jgi:hypothetical protein